jgi:hypothetical protein
MNVSANQIECPYIVSFRQSSVSSGALSESLSEFEGYRPTLPKSAPGCWRSHQQ